MLGDSALQFALSVHYRQVPAGFVDEVHRIVHDYTSKEPDIMVKAGKKVTVSLDREYTRQSSACAPRYLCVGVCRVVTLWTMTSCNFVQACTMYSMECVC